MVWIGVAGLTGLVALFFVLFTAKRVMKQDPGTPQMVAISEGCTKGQWLS